MTARFLLVKGRLRKNIKQIKKEISKEIEQMILTADELEMLALHIKQLARQVRDLNKG